MDAGAMVSVVVSTAVPFGVRVAGVNEHPSSTGRPVQEKEIVELKPPVGVTVSVTAFDVPPSAAVVAALEVERTKEPAGARIVRSAAAEVLGKCAESPVYVT